MNFQQSYFDNNRRALAIFRATSVNDADALAVLEQAVAGLPEGHRRAIKGMTHSIFAAAQAAPAGVGPERFFDAYSARLDDLERALS